jgi:hypothetical protein
MKQLPIGISDFKKLIQGGYEFIDKSLFIKDIVNNGSEVILITRPRRFGKTINLSMLYYYFTQAEEEQQNHLFNQLQIAQDTRFEQQHYHQYPTFFITFKGLKASTFDEFLIAIKTLISDLYDQYGSLLLATTALTDKEKQTVKDLIHETADISKLKNSIKDFMYFFYKMYAKKSILLIDEYDAPIHTAYLHGYYEPR